MRRSTPKEELAARVIALNQRLPGEEFPGEGLVSEHNVDKIAHVHGRGKLKHVPLQDCVTQKAAENAEKGDDERGRKPGAQGRLHTT